MALISAVKGKYPGKILVVGGGMRTLSDLESVQHHAFAAVISANDHAFRIPELKADFIVCKDHIHTQTRERMSRVLRKYGVPIISRQYWADYRLADWKLQGNSGLIAIAVAAVLGAEEIYPIGFDFFQEGTHFHEPDAKNVSRGRNPGDSRRKAGVICDWVYPTKVYPVSGPLVAIAEGPRRQVVPGAKEYGTETGFEVVARHELALPFDERARIVPRTRFWVSQKEYDYVNVRRSVDTV